MPAYDPENDKTVIVYEEELKLLRKIAETSDDLILAETNSEFRRMSGGVAVLRKAHSDAVFAHREWMSGFDYHGD